MRFNVDLTGSSDLPLCFDTAKYSPEQVIEVFPHLVSAWDKEMVSLPHVASEMLAEIKDQKYPVKTLGDSYNSNLKQLRHSFYDGMEPLANALLKVAERAESNQRSVDGQWGKYHNPPHFGHVAILRHYLHASFPAKDQVLDALVAFGHDMDHIGERNPRSDILYNERHSANVVAEVMKACGCDVEDIQFARLQILSTSPDGACQYLKEIVDARSMGVSIDHDQLKDEIWNKFSGANDFEPEHEHSFKEALDDLKGVLTLPPHDLTRVLSMHIMDVFPSVVMQDYFTDLLGEELGIQGFNNLNTKNYFLKELVGEKPFNAPPLSMWHYVYKDRLRAVEHGLSDINRPSLEGGPA